MLDPLFVLSCALYAMNRWIAKPRFHNAFLHNWFDDLLLIPCALPVVLYTYRFFKLRTHDTAPTFGEIAAHLVGWSLLFEVIGPQLMHHTTGDPWDVVAYFAGGLSAFLWWNRERARLLRFRLQ